MTVAEWDPYAPESLADPPVAWAELRERCPVAWSELMGGFWTVSRYEDVVAIARAKGRFNNSGGPQFGTQRPPLEVEELLRLETPVQAMPRWPNEDEQLHGQTLRAGETVMLFWAAANRDPGHFPEPDGCILDRTPNDHLAFGRGIHRCVGLDLARLELRVALEELLARTEWVGLAGEPVRTTFIRQGVSYLPVCFRS